MYLGAEALLGVGYLWDQLKILNFVFYLWNASWSPPYILVMNQKGMRSKTVPTFRVRCP